MDKAPDAFRTISEVAEDLDLPQHVLRFWETRFSQIRPMKRGGGRRYYRPDDVELLRGIRHLLYGEGYTIKGVQRILKEQGVRFVMEIWRNPGMPIPSEGGGRIRETEEDLVEEIVAIGDEDDEPAPEPVVHRAAEPAQPPAVHAHAAAHSAPRAAERPVPEEPLPSGILPEGAPARGGGFRLMNRLRAVAGDPSPSGGGGGQSLSREDVRRLQATLFELLECKRLLDQAR